MVNDKQADGSHDATAPETTHLTYAVFVSKTHNHTILWGVVLVFVLHDQEPPGMVISFTLATALELDLESLEVGFVFYNFDKPLNERNVHMLQKVKKMTIIKAVQ